MNKLPIGKSYRKNILMGQYMLEIAKATLMDMAKFLLFPLGDMVFIPVVGWLVAIPIAVIIAWIMIALGWRPQ